MTLINYLRENGNLYLHCTKQYGGSSKDTIQLEIELAYLVQAIFLLDICLKELKLAC